MEEQVRQKCEYIFRDFNNSSPINMITKVLVEIIKVCVRKYIDIYSGVLQTRNTHYWTELDNYYFTPFRVFQHQC